jgi:hypothetical protein
MGSAHNSAFEYFKEKENLGTNFFTVRQNNDIRNPDGKIFKFTQESLIQQEIIIKSKNMQKNMQNIRRHNYCWKDGEIEKLVYCNAKFQWRPPSGVLFLDCVKEGE